jgi:two-component system, cell cycle response regulator DivK
MAVPEPRASVRPSNVRRGAGLVLIVDDSLHTRDLYTEYLTFRGLGVVTAADAEAGVALAHTLKPDVIVMDLAMPGLNGITATHRLKQHPRTRRIPVIVLTGYAFRAIEQGALETGADVFLTKPCLPEELELRIRSLLG